MATASPGAIASSATSRSAMPGKRFSSSAITPRTVAASTSTIGSPAVNERNAQDAAKLADSDEEMDELRKSQFRILLGAEWPYSVEAAVDVALLGRYYERIADHAVIMAGRVIYVVTGTHPEGENWTYA